MIDPTTISVSIASERAWLTDHKHETGFSWETLAERSGIPKGTLSQFGPGTYRGDNEKVARDVVRYRQTVEQQAELAVDAPIIPPYVRTLTGGHIRQLLAYAHRGRVVVVAGGAGIGKTTECSHYAASASNVFVATMAPSTAGIGPMLVEVLAAMGEPAATGTPQQLSRRICDRARNANALIILDEAQHLAEKSVEEARRWHDLTGVGLALVGNHSVLERLEGGTRRAAYAQLYSRVSMRMIRPVAQHDDVAVLADAWAVTDPKELEFLVSIATKPGSLRSLTHVMELATILANGGERRGIAHMKAAWGQLSTRPVAA